MVFSWSSPIYYTVRGRNMNQLCQVKEYTNLYYMCCLFIHLISDEEFNFPSFDWKILLIELIKITDVWSDWNIEKNVGRCQLSCMFNNIFLEKIYKRMVNQSKYSRSSRINVKNIKMSRSLKVWLNSTSIFKT